MHLDLKKNLCSIHFEMIDTTSIKVEYVSDVNGGQVDKPNQKRREKVGVEKERRHEGRIATI
uniref:Uncharacterized protein n=1 Tax=Romanomermis culicivorax TaxID=13658 RepID=A0A915HGV3_ROMCU